MVLPLPFGPRTATYSPADTSKLNPFAIGSEAFAAAYPQYRPRYGILLSASFAAASMSGSSLIAAANAMLLKKTGPPGNRRQARGGPIGDRLPAAASDTAPPIRVAT